MSVPPGGTLTISGTASAELGGIVTLVRGGEIDVRRWSGPGWIEQLVAYCDRGGWKVRTISTPRTIYRDLQGSRARGAERVRPQRGGVGQPDDRLDLPEWNQLGRAGRIDLFERHPG